MTPHMPSRVELVGALVAVVAELNPMVASALAAGFQCGLEPVFEELAGDLDITVEQLIERFAAKVLADTGCEIIAAVRRESIPRRLQ